MPINKGGICLHGGTVMIGWVGVTNVLRNWFFVCRKQSRCGFKKEEGGWARV
jgi:hypothetical protein